MENKRLALLAGLFVLFVETGATSLMEATLQSRHGHAGTGPTVSSPYHDGLHEREYLSIVWEVTRFKSFISGISLGFYDDPTLLTNNDECFNQDAIDAVYNLIEGYNHGNDTLDKILKMMTAAIVFVVAIRATCHDYVFLYDLATYCFRSDQCDSMDTIIYNLGINIFQIVLNVMQLVLTLVVHRKPADIAELQDKY